MLKFKMNLKESKALLALVSQLEGPEKEEFMEKALDFASGLNMEI